MNREEIIRTIHDNLQLLYGIDGECTITIEEKNMIDELLRDIVNRLHPEYNYHDNHENKEMSPVQRKKISEARKGKVLSEGAKERQRQNSQRVSVYQYSMDGKLIGIWRSTREVQRCLNYNNSFISKCCRGLKKTAYGYLWRYSPISPFEPMVNIMITKRIQSCR